MEQLSDAQIERFIAAGRQIAGADLVRYSSGNLSWRVEADLVAVTARGAWLGHLTPDRIALVDLTTGAPRNEVACSVEAGFHRGILSERADIHVVLHCQSPYATALACGPCDEVSFDIIPEIPFYVGEVGVIPYGTPGSPELAASVVAAMRSHDLVILRNHGQVVGGRDFTDVVQKAGFFEFACELLTHGAATRPMAPDAVRALRERAARERSV